MILIGKLHPLLVHLPIGFLLIGLILHWWQSIDPKKQFSNTIGPIFFLGSIAATLSCLSGLQLMSSSEYDITTLERHRNTGISLTILSFYNWYLHIKNAPQKIKHFFAIGLLLLITITGHYGGTLTHGSGFLRLDEIAVTDEKKVITNIEDAIVYKDLIQPVIQTKCVSCHGPEKMKGKLRLDSEEFIVKGGKNGNPVSADAILLKRILLPPDDDEHMPPKEKGQLSNDEISLIQWWIQSGANFNATVKELKKDSSIQIVLNRIVKPDEQRDVQDQLPEVAEASPDIIEMLKKEGAVVSTVSNESNLLHVNFLNIKDSSFKIWEIISKISPQLYTLKADLPFVTSKHIQYLENAIELRKLSIKGSKVNDEIFNTIHKLKALQSLNISDTKVSVNGIATLKENKNLRFLYMLNIADSSTKINLSNVTITDRIQSVPTLASDTSYVIESKK